MIGLRLEELDTPVLLVDRAAILRNIARMADFFRGRPCQLRPHFKNHKCTTIARMQLAAGSAVGMTCAKLREAEVLADAGVGDILIANQLVGERKLDRLTKLASRINVKVAVDDPYQIEVISRTASTAGVTIGLLIEVDIGMGRCGVAPGEPALDLARRIGKLSGVRFDGLQAYEGHLVSVADPVERRRQTIEAMGQAVVTRRLIERAGIAVPVISGGSSSTYAVTGQIDGVDEIQAGTYVTMDGCYKLLSPEFDTALSVLARVISRPRQGVAVLDVGVKGVGHEFGPPSIKDISEPQAHVPRFSSEEHCVVQGVSGWRIGQVVELVPSHACTTCNLYRMMHVHEDGVIVDLWPIEASGQPS